MVYTVFHSPNTIILVILCPANLNLNNMATAAKAQQSITITKYNKVQVQYNNYIFKSSHFSTLTKCAY